MQGFNQRVPLYAWPLARVLTGPGPGPFAGTWPCTSFFWLEDKCKVTQQQGAGLLVPILRDQRTPQGFSLSISLCRPLLSVLKALQPGVYFACFAKCCLAVLCMYFLAVHTIRCIKLYSKNSTLFQSFFLSEGFQLDLKKLDLHIVGGMRLSCWL